MTSNPSSCTIGQSVVWALLALSLQSCSHRPDPQLDIGQRITIDGAVEVFYPKWSKGGTHLVVGTSEMNGGASGDVYIVEASTGRSVLVAMSMGFRFPDWIEDLNAPIDGECVKQVDVPDLGITTISLCGMLNTSRPGVTVQYIDHAIKLVSGEVAQELYALDNLDSASFTGFSMHEDKLAFSATNDNKAARLFLLDALEEFQAPTVLVESTEDVLSPSWSPDGRWIAYILKPSYSFDGGQIAVVRVDGDCRAMSYTMPEGDYQGLSWSPDGRTFALAIGDSLYLVPVNDVFGTDYLGFDGFCG